MAAARSPGADVAPTIQLIVAAKRKVKLTAILRGARLVSRDECRSRTKGRVVSNGDSRRERANLSKLCSNLRQNRDAG